MRGESKVASYFPGPGRMLLSWVELAMLEMSMLHEALLKLDSGITLVQM